MAEVILFTLLPTSLILAKVSISHVKIIWNNLLIVRCLHHIWIRLLLTAFGDRVDRATFINLFSVFGNTIVLQVGSIAYSAEGAGVNLVHH